MRSNQVGALRLSVWQTTGNPIKQRCHAVRNTQSGSAAFSPAADSSSRPLPAKCCQHPNRVSSTQERATQPALGPTTLRTKPNTKPRSYLILTYFRQQRKVDAAVAADPASARSVVGMPIPQGSWNGRPTSRFHLSSGDASIRSGPVGRACVAFKRTRADPGTGGHLSPAPHIATQALRSCYPSCLLPEL